MTMQTGKIAWINGDLHKTLVNYLPAFVDNPFSACPQLNIGRFSKPLGYTNEGVYKWLRSGKLTPDNVLAIVGLANSDENLTALTTLNRIPPKLEDFTRFAFA